MQRIVIVGSFGNGSLGDEAVLAAARLELSNPVESVEITAISASPKDTEVTHGVKSCAWSDANDILTCIKKSDAVVIAGGRIFNDVAPSAIRSALLPTHPPFLGPAVAAAVYRRPLFLLGVGLDVPVRENTRQAVQTVCEAATLITARDCITRDLLVDIGVPISRITVTADFVWALTPRAEPVAFSLGKPILGILGREKLPFSESLSAAVLDQFIQQTHGNIVFIDFSTWAGQKADTDQVRRRMAHRTDSITCSSPEQMLVALAGCEAVVAGSTEFISLGVLARKPVLALGCSAASLELRAQGFDGAITEGCLMGAEQVGRALPELCIRSGVAEGTEATLRGLSDAARENVRLLLNALPQGQICGEVSIGLLATGLGGALESPVAAESRLGRPIWENNREVVQKKQELSTELARSLQELGTAQEHARRAEARAEELESRLAVVTENNRFLQALIEPLQSQVERAAGLRRKTAAAIETYQSQFDAELRLFRSQRAWKLMLYCRKAYTVLIRSMEARKFPRLETLLSLVFSPRKGLNNYELRFPVLEHSLPPDLNDGFETYPAPPVQARRMMPSADARHRAPYETPTKYDVFILPVFEFDFRFQRPQHLAIQFARAGHRVFWISPSRTAANGRAYETVLLQPGLHEVRLRTALPNIYLGELKPEHIKAVVACLAELHRDFTVAESVAMALLPYWHRVGIALRETFDTKLVYDCMDDWQTMPNLSAFNRSEESLLAKEADVLIVTGRGLCERQRAAGYQPVLIRNGADFEFFSSAKRRGYLNSIPRPIVGYFGAIANWFDYDLLRQVAESRPNYSFVLIGGFGLEENLTHDDALRLKELPNVHLLGHKPYQEIPSYLTEFDVCTIPFVLNEVTKATDPVKLYEHLSQGKPVVATPMRELEEYRELIYIASSPAEFSKLLDAALAERGEEMGKRRIEFAARQEWSERWKKLDQAIRTAFPLVSILIVTHNSAEFVPLCLEALLRSTSYPAFEVIVVDNASKDRTVERIAEFARRDERIHLIRSEENIGFAAGNNLAAKAARGEYLILLNIDTIPTPGWVERLMRHIVLDPGVGLVVPVTNSIGNEAKIRVKYNNLAEMERFALSIAVERMGECLDLRIGPLFCGLVPRTVWDRVGPLDERFKFGMFEDDDFSHRIRKAGLRVVAAEDCFVHHFGGGSFSKLTPARYQEVFEANKRLFEEKWGRWAPHKYRAGVTAEEGAFRLSDFSADALAVRNTAGMS
jgi:GT2 family glycosyltransferase